MLSYIESIDYSIFLFLNRGDVNPLFDTLFPMLRELTYIFWSLLIVYFWLKKEKRLALIMTAGITAGLVLTYPVKFIIDRARPYEQIESARLLTPFEYDSSFPSGHAEISFLASTIVSRFHPSYGKYLYAFSFVVALSRVYVGVHFPTDVMSGAIIGVMIGMLVLKVSNKFRETAGGEGT